MQYDQREMLSAALRDRPEQEKIRAASLNQGMGNLSSAGMGNRMGLGGLIGRISDSPTPRDRSHLSEKLSDLDYQINDLAKLIITLGEKLGPVRAARPHAKNGSDVGECQPVMSDVCSDLYGKARAVHGLCQQVEALISECEV